VTPRTGTAVCSPVQDEDQIYCYRSTTSAGVRAVWEIVRSAPIRAASRSATCRGTRSTIQAAVEAAAAARGLRGHFGLPIQVHR
jgi:hypothetical protein